MNVPIKLPGKPSKYRNVRTGKPSKYRNVRTEHNGQTYDSKAEAERAAYLDSELAKGRIRGYQRQPRFALGCPENVYRADFLVWQGDGTTRVEDVKGIETAKFRRDRKLWAAYGPCPLWIIRKDRIADIVTPKVVAERFGPRQGRFQPPAPPAESER